MTLLRLVLFYAEIVGGDFDGDGDQDVLFLADIGTVEYLNLLDK